jgi:hypothetical protein
LLPNEVEKRVDLILVVATFSNRWLGESHVADLLCGKSVSRRILQGCLNEVEKRVDLVFVVTAFSDGRLGESHVADLLWSKATTRP